MWAAKKRLSVLSFHWQREKLARGKTLIPDLADQLRKSKFLTVRGDFIILLMSQEKYALRACKQKMLDKNLEV